MRPLGKNQLQLLQGLASLRAALVVPNKVSQSLVSRGLLAAQPDGSFAHLTPAGLRLLADEIDAGRVQMFSIAAFRAQELPRHLSPAGEGACSGVYSLTLAGPSSEMAPATSFGEAG